jgi:sporulation protein YlmC with PRC-barrel domain
MTMDIPLNVDVQCADGQCGRSTYVVVNPVTRKVTHVVVEERAFPHTEYLVPLELIAESTPTLIRLSCAARDLIALDPFIDFEFVPGEPYFDYDYAGEEMFMWPYALPDVGEVLEEYERIPPGELAVRRGARVEATDGHVGRVDEFLVDPESEHITHLILREGHLWGQKDVTIPVSQIDRIEEDIVYLKLDKSHVEALPAVPVRRR